MSYTRFAVPVALGLSLATVTAFVVYYIFKKDEVYKRGSVKTSRVNVIEISVSKSIVPALIGRSGSNIKEIERKSGALIHFKKFTDAEHDVCIIRGRSEATQLAETLVHEFIRSQPLIVEDTLAVPSWSIGRIIGTGGDNINDISHRSGARVKIDGGPSNDNTAMRKITFRGAREEIDRAKGFVQTCIAQEKCRREIEQCKRSPRHVPSPPATPHPASAPAPAPTVTSHDNNNDGDASELPEVSGSSIEVYVSAVSSPARFWVQFAGAQVTQLDELVQTMTDYYSYKDNREMHALSRVSVGQVVAAVFRHDGRWYRARVVDIRPNEFDPTKQAADVFFVDYGDSEYVATHELCELRADLLRMRFQAMECFLAGVRPAGPEAEVVGVTESGQRWDKWPAPAVERFEELTQVARWKALLSKTCSYRNTVTADGEKEREIPGIMLYDVTEEGSVDIGGVLIAEGWAVRSASPRTSPARAAPAPPFGDLGKSHVLGVSLDRGERCASLPAAEREGADPGPQRPTSHEHEDPKMPTSQSLSSGLEHQQLSPNLPSLSYGESSQTRPSHNGSQDSFLQSERHNLHNESSEAHSPSVTNLREEFKANMNRIDSHPSLEALARAQQESQKGF